MSLSGTFRMKRSRLRLAAACVRTLRHRTGSSHRSLNLNSRDFPADIRKNQMTVSVTDLRRRRRSCAPAIRRVDDVVQDVFTTSSTAMMTSQFEMTSFVDLVHDSYNMSSDIERLSRDFVNGEVLRESDAENISDSCSSSGGGSNCSSIQSTNWLRAKRRTSDRRLNGGVKVISLALFVIYAYICC